jgi:branched-chain amino acid transport system substrate-binding protein
MNRKQSRQDKVASVFCPGRAVVAGSLILASFASAGIASGSSVDTGTAALTIGVFQPFSGPDASFGPEEMAGCIPAAAAIEAAGGILKHKTLKCKPTDTRGDPADAVPAASQLIATTPNVVGILGPSSDEAAATVPIINRSQIPMMADTGQALFDKNSYRYFFRNTPADDATGYAMAVFAKDKGYKRAVAIFGNDISAQGSLPTVTAGFKHLGGKMALSETLPLDQSSYRSEVEKVAAAKPDVIFTEADPQTSATFFAELQQLYHLVPIIGTTGTNEPSWRSAVRGAIGAKNFKKYYSGVQPYAPTTGPANVLWVKAFNSVRTKVSQPASQYVGDSYAEANYDGVNVMALAMQAAKSTTPSVYIPFIVKVANGSSGAVVVHSFAQGKKELLAGKAIKYVGATGVMQFDRYNNSPGLFEVVGSNGTTAIATFTPAQVNSAK